MPVFLGTLALNDVTDINSLNEQLPAVADHMSQHMKEEAVRMAKENAAEAAAEEAAEAAVVDPLDNIRWRPNKNRKIATNKSVVLENAAYGFKHPNILDAKLGRRLWADDAPLEKKKRFDDISKATTNGSHGFRIAGMRVYKGSDDPAELDEMNFKVYDKDYGRLHVNSQNIVDEMRKFIFNDRAGIDEDLGRCIAFAFLQDLKKVEQVLANEESRMYSASLLFTFEGDGDALREAIQSRATSGSARETSEVAEAFVASSVNGIAEEPILVAVQKEKAGDLPGLSSSRVDSAIVLDDDGEILLRPGESKNGMEQVLIDGEIDLDMEDDDSEMSTLPHIFSLKLIDFAHATWVPGQGPDENNLLGVRSLIKIFEQLSA
jgi:1D-myo-inositol-tetrakisphosphate 5-kinase/inositol-polyphosphate multikinase